MFLIYETLEDALVKADEEGSERGYAYHKIGSGTRFYNYPIELASGKYALDVTDYVSLNEEEIESVSETVQLPEVDELT